MKGGPRQPPALLRPEWGAMVADPHWEVYRRAISALRGCGLPFMLGGGFALGVYTDRWRNTKDIDFYVLPEMEEPLIEALGQAHFVDFHEQLPYDRGWIYRST